MADDDAGKRDKSSVEYGPAKAESGERCGNCRYFLKGNGTCRKVKGSIDEGYWCMLWEAKRRAT